MTLEQLIARWQTDEGKPYKGSLIDMDAYNNDPTNPGCMCAQGQVLHDLGGWTPDQLAYVDQREADHDVATLLNISRAHAVLLRTVNDNADGAPAIVLTDPGVVLGDQWEKLLDFWWHLGGMNAAARDAEWDAEWEAARARAGEAAGEAAGDAAGTEAGDAAGTAAGTAAGASNEIQGATILRQKGQPFFFLPMFGFASPEEIPPRPANYGKAHQ